MSTIKFHELSLEADQDLEEIFHYTRKEFSLDQAIKYLQGIDELTYKLVDFPEMGKERPEIKVGLRSMPFGSHVIFYRILTDRIRIVRVLHASRDIQKLKD